MVMGGACQETHKHELMKPTKAQGESVGLRINLTLRAFHEAPVEASRKRQRDALLEVSRDARDCVVAVRWMRGRAQSVRERKMTVQKREGGKSEGRKEEDHQPRTYRVGGAAA